MPPTPRLLVLAALCCVCACECERGQSPKRSAQPSTARNRVIELPPGDPVSAEKLAKLLPREVGGYRASGPSEQHTAKLSTDGRRPVVRRSYAKGEQQLELELTDTHHAPAVRAIMRLSHAVADDGDEQITPTEVRGFPALSRYHPASRSATVNVLVADRFLLNLELMDVPEAQPALDVAGSIDLAAVARLVPTDGAADSDEGAHQAPAAADPTEAR